jgi:hypothetical protein
MNKENTEGNQQEDKQIFFVKLNESFSIFGENRKIHLELGQNKFVKSLIFDVDFRESRRPYSGDIDGKWISFCSNKERLMAQGLIVSVSKQFMGIIQLSSTKVLPEVIGELAKIRLQESVDVLGRVEHSPSLTDISRGEVNFFLNLPLVERDQLKPVRVRFISIEGNI